MKVVNLRDQLEELLQETYEWEEAGEYADLDEAQDYVDEHLPEVGDLKQFVREKLSHCFKVSHKPQRLTLTADPAAKKRSNYKGKRARARAAATAARKAVNPYFEGCDPLEALQEMCEQLVGETGDSKTACRNLLKGVYVNIIDYVAFRTGKTTEPPRIFKSRSALARYSRGNDKIYPKASAKGSALKELLQQLFFH